MSIKPVTPRLGSRPLVVSAGGAVGVLLIHALLVFSFVLSLSAPSLKRPNTAGIGASAFDSTAEPEMTVVFINEPTPAEPKAPAAAPTPASRGVTPPDLQLVVLSPDPSLGANVKTADSEDTAQDTASAGAAEHARLYGRYLGQLQARIERAWVRPRTEIGAPQFSCRTRIQQDRRGTVVNITLDLCNGTEHWQQSLLSAIRTASPLPAPPDASVYADVLSLSFSSEGFKEGGTTQGFEPEMKGALAERNELEAFQRFANPTRGDHKPDDKETVNVIRLTIIGTPGDHSTSNYLPAESPPARELERKSDLPEQ